jgi:hypothetical protein
MHQFNWQKKGLPVVLARRTCPYDCGWNYGKLWNLTGQFSKEQFTFLKQAELSIITLKLTPSKDLVPGNYTLTVGAKYDTVTYSKILTLSM